jgi:hypothetical protein
MIIFSTSIRIVRMSGKYIVQEDTLFVLRTRSSEPTDDIFSTSIRIVRRSGKYIVQ